MTALILTVVLILAIKATIEIRQFKKNVQQVVNIINTSIATIDVISSTPPNMDLSINKYLANFKQELGIIVDEYSAEKVNAADKIRDTVGEILVIRQTFQLKALETISSLTTLKTILTSTKQKLSSLTLPTTSNIGLFLSELDKAIAIKKQISQEMEVLIKEKNDFITKTNSLCTQAKVDGEAIQEGVGKNICNHFWVTDPIIKL